MKGKEEEGSSFHWPEFWAKALITVHLLNWPMSKLAICEKNISARRISHILSNGKYERRFVRKIPVYNFTNDGEEYTIVGLRGHIKALDYPEEYNRWEKVDPKDLVWLRPEKRVILKSLASVLRDLAKGKDEVIIATDYDREGELIGVEALEILKEANHELIVKRAQFSALTPVDVKNAFEKLVDVDYLLAESAESRQLIDLAWGATLTRFISLASNRTGNDFLSVGRVQSPTLALIVDREKSIESFVPKHYWEISATFEKEMNFDGKHTHGRFWEKKDAEEIFDRIREMDVGIVISFLRREKKEWPPIPFNTTLFLAEANKQGFSATRAMKLAEDLYSQGRISYPRTDNTVYPKNLNLRSILERLRNSEFSKEAEEILHRKVIRPSKGKVLTTDHPPIHPVAGVRKTELGGDHWKIYELICRRFLATVAPPALAEITEAEIWVNGEFFLCTGYVLKDKGWREYYPFYDRTEVIVPELEDGEEVHLLKTRIEEGKTKPPLRYTQGSLIQKMEKIGLGTKSTRHQIIKKLFDRKYAQGKYLSPTISGRAVIEALESHANRITKPEMTSTLEEDMLKIARGERKKEEVVRESQTMLEEVVKSLDEHKEEIGKDINEALRKQNYVGKCDECGGDLLIIRSKNGGRFIGCSNYPKCKKTHPLPPTGKIIPVDKRCEVCGSPMIKIFSGGRYETICIDSECPSVREKNLLGKCDECGGDLLIRHSRKGKRFVGCSNYPKCEKSFPLPQKGLILPTSEKCPTCGQPIIRVVLKGRKPWSLCINPDCESKKK